MLVPVVGLAAFTLVTPITVLLLVVLGFLILSYRQTIKAYPSAGGAYIVTRDNFGLLPAQVAGVALLTDYVLTVAVSVAAGTDALASAFPALAPYKLWIAIGFVVLIAFGNLRGTKESGKLFAVPTYFFVANMAVLLGRRARPRSSATCRCEPGDVEGCRQAAPTADWLFMGAGVFIVLKAFGSGGAAVTGVEAISNGVPAFRPPAWKNARDTLVYHGRAARRDVPRAVVPGVEGARHAVRGRHPDRHLAGRQAASSATAPSGTRCSSRCRRARC